MKQLWTWPSDDTTWIITNWRITDEILSSWNNFQDIFLETWAVEVKWNNHAEIIVNVWKIVVDRNFWRISIWKWSITLEDLELKICRGSECDFADKIAWTLIWNTAKWENEVCIMHWNIIIRLNVTKNSVSWIILWREFKIMWKLPCKYNWFSIRQKEDLSWFEVWYKDQIINISGQEISVIWFC